MVPLMMWRKPTPRTATCQRLALVLMLATRSKHVDNPDGTMSTERCNLHKRRKNQRCRPPSPTRRAGWETSAPMHIILPAVLFAF